MTDQHDPPLMHRDDGVQHLFTQGAFTIAVNEACVVTLADQERTGVTVTFFTYRWHQSDQERAAVHAEALRRRINSFKRQRVSAYELVAGIAKVCLESYQVGQQQGWMHQLDPVWKHDCEGCIYLGPMSEEDAPVKSAGLDLRRVVPTTTDLYYCPVAKPYPTVIARAGSDPGEYHSGLLFGATGVHLELAEAYRRAKHMHLLDGTRFPGITVLDRGPGGGEKEAWLGTVASKASIEKMEELLGGESDE